MMIQFRSDNISSGAMTSFAVSTRNPQKSPPLVRNFWVLEHYMPDQTVRFSGLRHGWAVIPLLTEVSVRMTGLLRGPGSLTQLRVSFMPTSNAEEVQITALAPQGFDFTNATASLAGVALGRAILYTTTTTTTTQREWCTEASVLILARLQSRKWFPGGGGV